MCPGPTRQHPPVREGGGRRLTGFQGGDYIGGRYMYTYESGPKFDPLESLHGDILRGPTP